MPFPSPMQESEKWKWSRSVVSDSVQPQRRQPTRLPHPWDSPSKNTGVGCHFLLQCMKVKSESEVAQLCPTLSNPMDCSPPGSSIHGIFQTRVLEWGAIAFSMIYCNNQLKKYRVSFLRLAKGAFSVPLLMSMSEAFSVPFYTLIKFCYTKALEWSSLVSDPKAKSSLEIMNLTLFTISSQ